MDLSQASSNRIFLKSVGESSKIRNSLKINNYFEHSKDRVKDRDDQQLLLIPSQQIGRPKYVKQKHQQITFNLIQDPRQSEFTFRKYVLFQKIVMILTILHICLCMIRTQLLQSYNISSNGTTDYNLTIIMSILTLILGILILMRSVSFNQLRIDQKKVYKIRRNVGIFGNLHRFFSCRMNLIQFLAETSMIILHPNFLTHGVKIQIFETLDQVFVKYDINDMLGLISLFRIYLVMRALINLTQYSTPRAVRLCGYNRVDHNLLYSIKCLIQERPLLSISVVFITQMIVLGYGLRTTQGSVYRQNPNANKNGFQNYINCFWCTFITMTTVGYGDYYPKSISGRMVIVFAAVSGIIVSSLLIVSLSAYLKMNPRQVSSHLILARLKIQKQLKEQASLALIQTLKLQKYLKSSKNNNQLVKIQDLFTNLKSKIDSVKYKSRKIKSMINTNNILQQMYSLFQFLKQNLTLVYQYQLKLKTYLMISSKFQTIQTKKKKQYINFNKKY